MMKKLLGILVLSLLWCNGVQALPKCEGENVFKWTDCIGAYIISDGDTKAIDFNVGDEKKLDVYEDYPILYKKHYFYYYGKKVMTYTMVKKSVFKFPTERYLNIVKKGYRDCKLNIKYLNQGLKN